jgi:hypothetical protein
MGPGKHFVHYYMQKRRLVGATSAPTPETYR